MVDRITDSLISLRIHSHSRHALKKLVTGLALQDDSVGCNIWEKLLNVSGKNIENFI